MEIGTSDNYINGKDFLEADKIMNVEEYENINRLKKGFYMTTDYFLTINTLRIP
jgi:hypothetical protein